MGSAAGLAAVAAFLEIRTVGVAWSTCNVGVNGAANGFYLLFVAMPVLWIAQTVLIGVPAPLLAFLSRDRLVVAAAMGLYAAGVVMVVAWVFFAHSGLPLTGDYPSCAGTRPGWWPGWLPPRPSPYY